ncbi:MAG: hypothetical protein PHC41_15270 [Lachnospiraceae bacterium]|nr:hypothetical protein [Lachnospiraceae bacterium]MDD3617558.1 hypothetical protein [Lachnospiraceae bacterium]
MFSVLLRAFSFTFIILIGIMLRSKKIVGEQAGDAVKKVMLNITLPAVIITNFAANSNISMDMILLAVLGLVFSVFMVWVGVVLSRRKTKAEQALYILSLPSYNIGAFCLPFVQGFLPSIGSVVACTFDVGNSIMCTGGTYAFTVEYTGENKGGVDIKEFFKKLVTSPPLMVNIVMFVLTLAHIKLPEPVITFIEPISRANTFMAMLMLGLLFHLELKRDYLKDVMVIVGLRYLFAVITALGIYYFLPFDLIIRQTLVLVCFAPMSAAAPAYTGMCGGDEGKSSCANSITIICSLVIITTLIAVMGLNA